MHIHLLFVLCVIKMAFAHDLLTFLSDNRPVYECWCGILNPDNLTQYSSNFSEFIIITRGGDVDEVIWWGNNPNSVRWCPDSEVLMKYTNPDRCSVKLYMMIWEHTIGHQSTFDDLYAKLITLGDKDVQDVYMRRHKNGIISLQFSLSDKNGEDAKYISTHIDKTVSSIRGNQI